MQGFKGLVSRQALSDQSFQPIYKKAEDHRKAAQLCIDFFQQINKFFQSFSVAVEKCAQDSDIDNMKASYYCLIGFVCTKLLIQNKVLTENTKGSSKQLTKNCNTVFDQFSKFLQLFQANLRKYQENEAIIQQMNKKYYRSHKNLISSIQAYKNSLTDVTLIYNQDQKFNRYQACENNYKIVSSQYGAIQQKTQSLNQRKIKIFKNWEDLKSEFTKLIKSIGSQVIGQTRNFVSYYCKTNKSIVTFLAEQKYNLSKQKLDPFFRDIEDPSPLQRFNINMNPQNKPLKSSIPLIFQYPQLIKQQFLQTYNLEMLNYLKKVQESAERRKSQNKKIYQLFLQYFKTIEKVHIIGVKELISNFNKIKPKIVQAFGSKLASFMKVIITIFQQLGGINEKLVKTTNQKIVNILALLNEQNKNIKLFNEQLKTNIEKFIGKKELKKLKEEQFTEQASLVNLTKFRKQACTKAQFFKHLIKGFDEKMAKNCEKISQSYTDLIDELSKSINQFYSLNVQHQQYYFGEQYNKKYQLFQKDVQDLVQKNKGFFQQLVLSNLKGDNSKISFDGQLNKAQQFKKLKKPTPIQGLSALGSIQKQLQKKDEKQKQGNEVKSLPNVNSEDQKQADNSPQKMDSSKLNGSQNIQKTARKLSSKDSSLSFDDKQSKNAQYLLGKIQFKQNQQLIKSFSCALSQKIVLQGRIYITTDRICFSSNFKSNILFFSGSGTFIQFPKEDVVKVQKRMNAIFMDNSISITTLKGQLFFTSFFSRNQAYDLICHTYGISLDEHVYQYQSQQLQLQPQIMIKQIIEQDDIKQNQLQERKTKIDAIIQPFAYVQAAKGEISKEGITAYQLFKMFYSDSQITINRRKYQNFLLYIKQLLNHKDVQVSNWQPPLSTFMNTSNIKSNAGLKSVRKILATVPVANSGVPFMPKTAKSEQTQTLFFYSKNKWILQSQIATTGAPYTDTFKVQLKTSYSSHEQNKCEISIGLYVNFIKNTMMKSVIESKTQQETTKASRIWVQQIKKYFVNLAKLQNSFKKQSDNPLQSVREQLQAKIIQFQNSQQQKQALRKQIEQLKLVSKKQTKAIMALSAICIFLLLLLLAF